MSDTNIYIECPHCNQLMELIKQEINCAIYRHGIFKDTGGQMDPHAPKQVCDELVEKDLIYGCGKPFKIFENKNPVTKIANYYVEKCDYI